MRLETLFHLRMYLSVILFINVELELGRGGQLVRAAGLGASVVAKEGDYVTLKLPSGEMRMVFQEMHGYTWCCR